MGAGIRQRGQKRVRRTALLLFTLCGCRQELASASQAAAGHAATFMRFERWAGRVDDSDVALRGLQALREATFAPLRGDRSVLWAEVQSSSGERVQLAKPLATESLAFVRVDTPELRDLRVAVVPDCRPGSKSAIPCVVLARARGEGDQRAVSVAFRLERPDAGALATKP